MPYIYLARLSSKMHAMDRWSLNASPPPSPPQACTEVLCACEELDVTQRDRWNHTPLDMATGDTKDILLNRGTRPPNPLPPHTLVTSSNHFGV